MESVSNGGKQTLKGIRFLQQTIWVINVSDAIELIGRIAAD